MSWLLPLLDYSLNLTSMISVEFLLVSYTVLKFIIDFIKLCVSLISDGNIQRSEVSLFSPTGFKSLDLKPELSSHFDNCSTCCILIKYALGLC